MGTLLMQIMMKYCLRKRGKDKHIRLARTVKRCLTFSHTSQFDNVEEQAK